MKLSTKSLILVSWPVWHSLVLLLFMAILCSSYERALVKAGLESDLIASTSSVKLCMVIATILMILTSISLSLFFSRLLTKRIARACDDLKKIQSGAELEPPPSVSDEFAQLDTEIRKMAAVVRGL